MATSLDPDALRRPLQFDALFYDAGKKMHKDWCEPTHRYKKELLQLAAPLIRNNWRIPVVIKNREQHDDRFTVEIEAEIYLPSAKCHWYIIEQAIVVAKQEDFIAEVGQEALLSGLPVLQSSIGHIADPVFDRASTSDGALTIQLSVVKGRRAVVQLVIMTETRLDPR